MICLTHECDSLADFASIAVSPFCSNIGSPPVLASSCLLVNDYFTDTYIISDCGLSAGAYVFLAAYYFGCVFIFLPLFIATLIDYFTNPTVQVETLSIFNGDDCELYTEVWKEFDPQSLGEISIDNLRPFVDRLFARGHRAGFKVSSDLPRFKKIWGRIISDPVFFPPEGIKVDEKNRKADKLGLDRIDRNVMSKTYGLGKRAKMILDYVQKNWDEFNARRGREVRFEYAARVLCIYQEGNIQPLTTSDLVNLGGAVQMFMGLIGCHEVKGNEGKENEKWKPLAIHNQLQVQLKSSRAKKNQENVTGNEAAYENLPKILKAKGILLSDLYPKPIQGHEWKVKQPPTGAKRNELIEKMKDMDTKYEKVVFLDLDISNFQVVISYLMLVLLDLFSRHFCGDSFPRLILFSVQIMQNFIQEVLWGADKANKKSKFTDCSESKSCLLDELLDRIIDGVASKYASCVSQKLTHMLSASVEHHSHQRRFTLAAKEHLEHSSSYPVEPAVTTVPRGWLNSGRSGVFRQKMKPSNRLVDNTIQTLGTLRNLESGTGQRAVAFGNSFAAVRAFPTPPPRHASLGPNASKALRDTLRQAMQEDAWQQCQQPERQEVSVVTECYVPTMFGWNNDQTEGWKAKYQVTLSGFFLWKFTHQL